MRYSRHLLIVEEGESIMVSSGATRDQLERQSKALLDPARVPYLNGRTSIVDFEEGEVVHHDRNADPVLPILADSQIQQIASAMSALAFALRFEEAVRVGNIRSEMFGHAFAVSDFPVNCHLPAETFSTADITAIAHNMVIHAKSAALVCADELLRPSTQVDIKSGKIFDDNHMQIVNLVTLLRDAYAHLTGGPVWKAPRSRKPRRPIRVNLGDGYIIAVDTGGLSGQYVKPSHHNGVTGLFRLLGYVDRYARGRAAGSGPTPATPP
jgi:hypothetical protein